VSFAGDIPGDNRGAEFSKIIIGKGTRITEDLIACRAFSSKPAGGDLDYQAEVTAHVNIWLAGPRPSTPQRRPRRSPWSRPAANGWCSVTWTRPRAEPASA